MPSEDPLPAGDSPVPPDVSGALSPKDRLRLREVAERIAALQLDPSANIRQLLQTTAGRPPSKSLARDLRSLRALTTRAFDRRPAEVQDLPLVQVLMRLEAAGILHLEVAESSAPEVLKLLGYAKDPALEPTLPPSSGFTTVAELLGILRRGALPASLRVGASSKNVATRNLKAFYVLRQRAKDQGQADLTVELLEKWIRQVLTAEDCNVSKVRVLNMDTREFSDALDDGGKPATKPQAGGPWSTADSPTRWAKQFKISPRTFKRRVKDGEIRAKRLSDRLYQIHLDDLPKQDEAKGSGHN